MKIRKQKDIPVANRIFTDREEPRAAFWKNYDACRQSISAADGEIHILSFYGIGGIGKSRLLKHLMSEMNEKIAEPRYIYFDLNVHQESRAVLEAVKNKLSSAYGFDFPLFELGVYNYAKKIGEDADAPEIKAYVEKSPFLSLLLTVAGKIPVASLAAEVLGYADKGLAYIRTYLLNHRKELANIESKEANELYNYLPYLFSQDMAKNLEKAKEPLVIFLDTYERLVNEMSGLGEPLNKDLWIRGEDGLVQNIPNVLWVIAGREKLKWERFNPEWSTALEHHILGNLGPVDSDSFLASAGVGSAQLRGELYELTDGTPVYLDLCVDRFHDLTEMGILPTIESFGDNHYSLIERFVRYMDDNKKDIVYILACLQHWDDELIMDIAGNVLANFSISTYERVKNFSFIIDSEDGRYNIHQTVGSVMLANCPETLRTRTARYGLEYFEKKIKDTPVHDVGYSDALQYIVHFGLLLHEEEGALSAFYEEHVHEKLISLIKAGRLSQADSIFEDLWERAEKNKASLFYALAVKDRMIFTQFSGRYRESLEYAEEAAGIYKKLFGEDHPKAVMAMKDVAVAAGFLGNIQGMLDCLELIVDNLADSLGEDHPDTVTAVQDMAAVLNALQRHEEALDCYYWVLDKWQSMHGESHPNTVNCQNAVAGTLVRLGRYEEATAIFVETLQQSEALWGEGHPNTLSVINGFANMYYGMGKYEEAVKLQKQVYERRLELLGPEHPATKNAERFLELYLKKLDK